MKTKLLKFIITVVSLLLFSFIFSCSGNQLNKTETGAVAGTVIGSGLGAIIGHETGHTGGGVAIGAATGALLGGVVGRSQDKVDSRTSTQDEQIKRQEEELRRQRREIEELKRKQSDQEINRDSYKSRTDKTDTNHVDHDYDNY